MKTYLIGGRGRLGQAIATQYADDDIELLDRSVYEKWGKSDGTDRISRYFENAPENTTIFITAGLLNPSTSTEDLLDVNFYLPKNLIQGASKYNIKVVTFGTIMENLVDIQNSYIKSKRRLNDYVTEATAKNIPVLHLQLHTLYGIGEPSPFMFLGQILTALRNNTAFRMTSGRQLREYHHLADEAAAIRLISNSSEFGVKSLNHGNPTTLKSLATAIFSAFKKTELLQIGELPEPSEENYTTASKISPMLDSMTFRNSTEGIIEYMLACYSHKGIETTRA